MVKGTVVLLFLKKTGSSTTSCSKNVWVLLGDGRSINFWDDFLIKFPSLKLPFPRIYTVAIKKRGKVEEFGNKTPEGWVWNVKLRRRLFVWEEEIMFQFISVLEKAARGSGLTDTIKWSGDTSGWYKPKSYCVAIQSEAPPKVVTFVWKVAHGRVPTRSELAKRGVNCVNSLPCVLCVWRIWQRWCMIWKVHLVFPNKVKELIVLWDDQSIKLSLKCPNQCEISNAVHSRKKRRSWVAPPAGFLKFNVDAAVSGSYGDAGIGGILRNHDGLPLIKFAESVGFSNPTGAELKAIHKACYIFLSSRWRGKGSLIIETDSLLVVNWINNVCQAPIAFADIVRECSTLLYKHKWKIIFVFRESNYAAHELAREGVNQSNELHWFAV
ncbi:hypothetical protein GQ457_02G015730 [Hibiscus cannabinus]